VYFLVVVFALSASPFGMLASGSLFVRWCLDPPHVNFYDVEQRGIRIAFTNATIPSNVFTLLIFACWVLYMLYAFSQLCRQVEVFSKAMMPRLPLLYPIMKKSVLELHRSVNEPSAFILKSDFVEMPEALQLAHEHDD
jgi:hypothetical protein